MHLSGLDAKILRAAVNRGPERALMQRGQRLVARYMKAVLSLRCKSECLTLAPLHYALSSEEPTNADE